MSGRPSPVLPAIEAIVRHLRSRIAPPSLLLFDTPNFRGPGGGVRPAYAQPCEVGLQALASYYRISRISMRDALWHEATTPGHRLYWRTFMQPPSGPHRVPDAAAEPRGAALTRAPPVCAGAPTRSTST